MLKNAIAFGEFEVTFPIDDILALNLTRKAGEHSRFFVKGIASKEATEETMERLNGNQTISLFVKDGAGATKTRFSGPVINCGVRRRGEVYEMEAEAAGYTFLLDTERKKRSFQNADMTHEALTRAIADTYDDADFIMNCEDMPLKDMYIQYDETDWEFLKRIAGNLSSKLIPADGHDGARFFIGLREGGTPKELDGSELMIKKDIGSFLKDNKNGLPSREEHGVVSFIIHTDKWLDLGDPVKVNGNILYVYSAESELEGSLLLHTYTLRDANGFSEPKILNKNLAGISLFGTVTDILKDEISAALDIDKENKHCGSRLFPYSTVYSSPDGSGFYFMPEKGDRISLYLPSASESDAYARSSADMPSRNPEKRINPDNKEIYTKYGKQIRLTPSSAEIRSGDGLRICLYDNKGVEVHSAKNIFLNAGGNIALSGGGKINVSGKDIKFSQSSGTFVMDGDTVAVDGQEVKVGK